MLNRQSGMTVVGVKSDRSETAEDLLQRTPDVVLMDMATPDGHATVRDIRRLAPGVPVVALGIAGLEGDVLPWVEAGVAGYVTREASLEELVAVVESAARGELQCSPGIAGSLLRRVAELAADRGPGPSATRLTTREWEIVRLIEQDLSNKQIASRLGIEVATVKNHVHNLFEKLNVHRRTEAARLFSHSPGWTQGMARQTARR